jgi:hypothetical protein
MENHIDTLKQYLREQIALEEQLLRNVEEQLHEVQCAEYADARALLEKTKTALEGHFTPLNELLDQLERDVPLTLANGSLTEGKREPRSNRGSNPSSREEERREQRRISRILRDDFSALNTVALNNTLLHTSALALKCHDIASVALKHIENLLPLLVEIGTLVPEVVAREISKEAPRVHAEAAEVALKNVIQAWRMACAPCAR